MACEQKDDCEEAVTISTTTGDHPEHEKEGCGNFCNCSCCVHIVSVNFQPALILIDKPLVTGKPFSFYHNISLPSNYFGNIWQPPKDVLVI